MTQAEFKEYVRCCKDPVYFINTYGYAYNVLTKSVTKIDCFQYQEDILRKYHKNQNNIILKSRQTGLSVITAGFVAWTMCCQSDQRVLIIANDRAGAVRFLDTVKQFIQFLPKFILPKEMTKNNESEIIFSNGNWVKAVASGPNAGRGYALTMLILDETAFIDNADDIWMAAGIALTATKGKCIMLSTPNGTGSLYHKTWVEADKGKNDFVPTTIHWTQHPVYSVGKTRRRNEFGQEHWTSPWYENECERLGFDSIKIAQELDLSFEGSRALVIDSHIIARYKNEILGKEKPQWYYDFRQEGSGFLNDPQITTDFYVWKKPVENANYIVSCDVARGDAADYSTIQILDADNLEQVAEYQGKIPADLFATMIKKVATEYNMAYVVIECNNFGLATSLTLKNQLNYEVTRIYHSKSIRKLVNHHFSQQVDVDEEIPGFQTTTSTRPLLMATLGEHMREGKVKIRSSRLLSEFDTFVYNKQDKPEHSPGYHDDLIFAFAIGLFIRNREFESVFLGKEFYKTMIGMITHTTTSSSEVLNPSEKQSKIPKINYPKDNPDDDLSWLYGNISTG